MASEDLTWQAAHEAAKQIAAIDPEVNPEKMEKKLREYFRKATKDFDFTAKPWQALINDYADVIWRNLFSIFHEKSWLEQVDLLLVFDGAVKDHFPPHVLAKVTHRAFEVTVLAAWDRAYEEQRFEPILWEVVKELVAGQNTKKKISQAVEFGRKQAAVPNPSAENPMEDFTYRWIEATVYHIGQLCQQQGGDPQWCFPEEKLVVLFNAILAAGGLPLALTQDGGLPPADWEVVSRAASESYANAGQAAEAWNAKRYKGYRRQKVKRELEEDSKNPDEDIENAGAGVFNTFGAKAAKVARKTYGV